MLYFPYFIILETHNISQFGRENLKKVNNLMMMHRDDTNLGLKSETLGRRKF